MPNHASSPQSHQLRSGTSLTESEGVSACKILRLGHRLLEYAEVTRVATNDHISLAEPGTIDSEEQNHYADCRGTFLKESIHKMTACICVRLLNQVLFVTQCHDRVNSCRPERRNTSRDRRSQIEEARAGEQHRRICRVDPIKESGQRPRRHKGCGQSACYPQAHQRQRLA